ncbi:MAG: hypothetical protein GY820_08875 [Gammaproteobacteria bacterium]|nr:hypothetical protein [Gammaproteobacteria bacterium]
MLMITTLRKFLRLTLIAVSIICVPGTGLVHAGAGLLTGGAKALEPLTLSVVTPLAKAPYELESGRYYKIDIVSDGSGELALSGAEFFRNIWIDEVIINDIEIRPLGLNSLEFDDEGIATIKFVAIRPGNFVVRIPGSTGKSQQALFKIR